MCSILPISLLPKCVPLNPVLISKCVKVNSNGNFISLTRRINYKVPTSESGKTPLGPAVKLDKVQASHLVNRDIMCEYIDLTLGAKLGISTMAAAALGNTISDMMGIGSAWYVETLAVRLGAECPPLSKLQMDMFGSRIATNLGRCLGVMLGCLLGMFPLLFISTNETEDTKDNKLPKAEIEKDAEQ